MFLLFLVAAILHLAIMALLILSWRMGNEMKDDEKLRVERGELRVANSQLSTDSTPNSTKSEPISIIIAAHNEAENLKRFLRFALNQDFNGDYEVIVALDRCTDASAQVVADLQAQHPRLRGVHILALPEGWTGKKHALHLAIQAAKYENLAFTDADCELPPHWLKGIAAQFAAGKDLVLGLSPYHAAPGLLNLLIRFETFMTAILYVGLARLGLPYMGVGRSIAYRKSWFEAAGGFTEIAHRLSGDDDLLVNRAAKAGKTGLLLGLETQVISLPKTTWRTWISQKIRHGSAGTAYKPASILILSGIHGLHLIFYLSLIVVLCMQSAAFWPLIVYALRSVVLVALLGTLPWRHKTALMLAFPLLDFLYIVYLMLLLPAAAFIQPKWKNNHGGSV